jgi:uncharacterized protein with HEPN domain
MNTLQFVPAESIEKMTRETRENKLALERTLPRAMALLTESIKRINLDVHSAITTARVGWLQLRPLRAQIADELPKFDLSIIDEFEDRMRALIESQSRYNAETEVSDKELDALEFECARIREITYADLTALVARGVVLASSVARIREGAGREDLASDLLDMDKEIDKARAKVGDRLWITVEEQTYLRTKGTELKHALASLTVAENIARQRIELRQRVYTLFINDYDELRRAATYLRWREGDADAVVPSLFARGRRERAEPANPADPVEPRSKKSALDDMPQPNLDLDPTRPVPQDDPYAKG